MPGDQNDGCDIEEEHFGLEGEAIALEVRDKEARNQEEREREDRVFEREIPVGDLPREGFGGIVVIVPVRPFHRADIARPAGLQRSVGRPQPGIGRNEDHAMNRDRAEDACDELEIPSHYLSFPRP